jgi:hypothetical protein
MSGNTIDNPYVILLYLISMTLFVVSGYIEISSRREIDRPSNEFGNLLFSLLGLVSQLFQIGLFISGFFFFAWWVPLSVAACAWTLRWLIMPRLPIGPLPGISMLCGIAGLVSAGFMYLEVG